jgi:asparagine synthase (glutamine-hydrolysing)
MCGIAGFWSRRLSAGDARSVARRMAGTLEHRGPDDEGCWVDENAGIALAHRRLAIVDLSPLGHQPMTSARGRYVLSYNGEVYNHCELRRELIGRAEPPGGFCGRSDTEVMLAAIEAFGLETAVKRFVGMFAFALWDQRERVLHLGRDRLGIKPLYYGWTGTTFLFGSELKALVAHPDFTARIDRSAVALMMRLGYVPSPYCIYRDVRKLTPGTILTIRSVDMHAAESRAFWSVRQSVESAADATLTSAGHAVDQLDALLREAIRLRMIADVPLGAFLSGGVDSSTVVALMQAQATRPVRTFTIGFTEDRFNEAHHARSVARHLGTDHTELYITPRNAQSVIPDLPRMYDEPFADASQIPTYLVSALARDHVTVALSGDGGDELFGGYNRHIWARRLWDVMRMVPQPIRALNSRLVHGVAPDTWDRLFGRVHRTLGLEVGHPTPGAMLHKLARALASPDADAMYVRLVSQWDDPQTVVVDGSEPQTWLPDAGDVASLVDATDRMMYLDLLTYLPDDILTKVDRASMAVGLEARVPLLDHRVVEFAWRVPQSMKIRQGEGKWLLRQVLYRYVPRELIERPKAGFAVPIGAWLRGPLRPWAEELLDERRLRDAGLLAPTAVRRRWSAHLAGTRDEADRLWNVLMFQAWLEASREESARGGACDHRLPLAGVTHDDDRD